MKLLKISVITVSLFLAPALVFAEMHKGKNMDESGMRGGMMMSMMSHKQMMKMHKHMQEMRELMDEIRQEKDPEKHRQMMKKHMESMREGMHMMHGRQCDSDDDGNDDDSPCTRMSDMGMDNRMDMMEKRMNMMQMMMDQMMQHQQEEKSVRMHGR